MKKIALAIVSSSLLGACASTPAPQTTGSTTAKPVTTAPTVDMAAKASTAPVSAPTPAASSLPRHLDPGNPLYKQRSVYFDFDVYAVKPADLPLIESHAKYLGGNKQTAIKVEGNADERGSREYNLALGQKRAEAIKKLMVINGVGETQVETISWGKEKPRALGHDEAAWAENRRADIVYPDDKK